jgi:glyceraldehyde 3-phosphate dehydrogenase
MVTKVVVNGLGRSGRSIPKLVTDEPSLELVAVNDPIDVANLACLLRFDTVYGRYANEWGYPNQMLCEAVAIVGGPGRR